MEDRLFDVTPTVDRNSHQFDLALLEEIKALKNIPAAKFETIMRRIMRKKSSCKLWYTNIPSTEWDGTAYRDCNYRCCPSSHKARSFFCLMLDRTDGLISVTDGFLTAI